MSFYGPIAAGVLNGVTWATMNTICWCHVWRGMCLYGLMSADVLNGVTLANRTDICWASSSLTRVSTNDSDMGFYGPIPICNLIWSDMASITDICWCRTDICWCLEWSDMGLYEQYMLMYFVAWHGPLWTISADVLNGVTWASWPISRYLERRAMGL